MIPAWLIIVVLIGLPISLIFIFYLVRRMRIQKEEDEDDETKRAESNGLIPPDRLLTEKEIGKLVVKGDKAGIEGYDAWMKLLLEAQDAKTASIKNAEGQARIKGIMNWWHEPCPHTGGIEEEQMYKAACPKCWQALKEQEGVK